MFLGSHASCRSSNDTSRRLLDLIQYCLSLDVLCLRLTSKVGRSDTHRRVLPYSLHFACNIVRMHIQDSIFFQKPNWGPNRLPVLAVGFQRNHLFAFKLGKRCRFAHYSSSLNGNRCGTYAPNSPPRLSRSNQLDQGLVRDPILRSLSRSL